MIFFPKKCGACKKKRFFVKERFYEAHKVGKIRSQSEHCRKCAKIMQLMLNSQFK